MPWFRPAPLVGEPLPVQSLDLRRLDRLPTFAARIQNERGEIQDLTGYSATMTLRCLTANHSLGCTALVNMPLTVEAGTGGLVSYDWQTNETGAAYAGVFDVVIHLTAPGGARTTVPTVGQASIVRFRPALSSGYLERDGNGAFVLDGDGYAVVASP
jgi:hypothetical protein